MDEVDRLIQEAEDEDDDAPVFVEPPPEEEERGQVQAGRPAGSVDDSQWSRPLMPPVNPATDTIGMLL